MRIKNSESSLTTRRTYIEQARRLTESQRSDFIVTSIIALAIFSISLGGSGIQ